MKKTLAAAAAACLLASGAASAAVADFTVNGQKVTAAEQEQMLQAAAAQGQERTPELEAFVKDRLTDHTLLVQEAKSQKLESDPAIARQIEQARSAILAQAALGKYLRANTVTEDQIKAAYEAEKAAYGPTEYRVRHLLVKTETEAQKALERIKSGEDFAKVAEEVSIDQGSKANGGDLDWASPAQMVKPFGDAMKSQKKGELSAKPVQTQFGFHVLRVEDTRAAELFPAYEHMKPQLRKDLTEQKVRGYLDGLRAKAKIN